MPATTFEPPGHVSQIYADGITTVLVDSIAADTVEGRIPHFIPVDEADSLRDEALADSMSQARMPMIPSGLSEGIAPMGMPPTYVNSTPLAALLMVRWCLRQSILPRLPGTQDLSCRALECSPPSQRVRRRAECAKLYSCYPCLGIHSIRRGRALQSPRCALAAYLCRSCCLYGAAGDILSVSAMCVPYGRLYLHYRRWPSSLAGRLCRHTGLCRSRHGNTGLAYGISAPMACCAVNYFIVNLFCGAIDVYY